MKHYNDDLTKLDFDLFDAIDRRVLIKYMDLIQEVNNYFKKNMKMKSRN